MKDVNWKHRTVKRLFFNEHPFKSFDYLSQPSLRMAKHGKTSVEWAELCFDLYGQAGLSHSPRTMSGGVGISETEDNR